MLFIIKFTFVKLLGAIKNVLSIYHTEVSSGAGPWSKARRNQWHNWMNKWIWVLNYRTCFNCISVKLNFVQILMLLNVLDLKLDLWLKFMINLILTLALLLCVCVCDANLLILWVWQREWNGKNWNESKPSSNKIGISPASITRFTFLTPLRC